MNELIFGTGIAHTILLFALVIATGIYLGRFKVKGVSIGSTWILFVGILLSHFGFRADPHILSFMKDFGLILFVFSIGLQVGPGFFSSFRHGGVELNLLAVGAEGEGIGIAVFRLRARHAALEAGTVGNVEQIGALGERLFAGRGRLAILRQDLLRCEPELYAACADAADAAAILGGAEVVERGIEDHRAAVGGEADAGGQRVALAELRHGGA